MVKNARFFGQTFKFSYFETPIKELFGTRQTVGKVSYLPGLRPDAADSRVLVALMKRGEQKLAFSI